jgi:hypothetical protein
MERRLNALSNRAGGDFARHRSSLAALSRTRDSGAPSKNFKKI